ncbi:MAG: polysaccharide biosynthesis tyrosine autokinase [Pseudomonadota bacterium]|nr:polysaccharide biosynthesis tyrosine autokinase [Pseudomonadota bacterium]
MPDHGGGVDANDQGELQAYFHVLLDNLWLIVAVAVVVSLAGMVYALGTRSVYESNMTFQVEETGPNAAKNVLSEASSLFESKRATVAEMELLRSRMVIAPVVDALRLHIEVKPTYFPLVGAAIAQARGGKLSTPGLFGVGGYVWGDEALDVATFDLPPALQQHTFAVTVTGRDAYRLSDTAGSGAAGMAWDGKVGVPLRMAIGGHVLVLKIARIDARAGARFTLRGLSKQVAVAAIQAGLHITEQGKQSGVVEVRLEGENPALIQAILAETAREYLRQTLARRREDAEKSLAFLTTQLVPLRSQLDRAEAQYGQLQRRHGSLNLADKVRVGVEQAAASRARRDALEERKIELLSRFTENHPILLGLEAQLKLMDSVARKDTNTIESLAEMEQEEHRISRDIKVKSELYSALSATAQQLRVLAASSASNVRLIDAPGYPEAPIKPNRSVIMSVSVMAGLVLGMVAAFARRAMFAGIDGPHTVEKMLGTKVVHVSIPHSSYQRQLVRQAERGARQLPMLARVAPEDPTVDALRGFRAALQFSMPHFRNNIVLITGPTSRLGKSFISANSATVIAASGKRVLLIDADLRKGQLHRYFDNVQVPGLYEAVNGSVPVHKVIRHDVMKNLDFMSTGARPRNPSECLTQANLAALLAAVRNNYDVVIIDAPGVLDVADALIIGAQAGAVYLLARADRTTEQELRETIVRLSQAGIVPEGFLFNDLRLRRGMHGYQYKAGEAQQIDCAG